MITKEEFEKAYQTILTYKKQIQEEMSRIERMPIVVSRDTTILDLNLSVRAWRCLHQAEISTVGELMKHDLNKLHTYRNVGKKTVAEVKELLEGIIVTPS